MVVPPIKGCLNWDKASEITKREFLSMSKMVINKGYRKYQPEISHKCQVCDKKGIVDQKVNGWRCMDQMRNCCMK